MKNKQNRLSRRQFLGLGAAVAGLAFMPGSLNASDQKQKKEKKAKGKKPDSKFGGVQVGAITYSWRSMPSTPEDIIKYCQQTGISSIELMGDVAEKYAGLPAMPARPGRNASEDEKSRFAQSSREAADAQKKWRLSAPMAKFAELRKMFNDAGIQIHITKFSPGSWSDEEIDYAFRAAKVLGSKAVCDEIGEQSCKKMGPIALKHGMYAVFHNHLQPGEPGFSFDKYLEMSPANMLNFDVGHYYGATGLHPNEVIEKHHDRILSLHMKDKTGPKSNPANTNMPWGEGETPISDILLLLKKNKWNIHADIELEYNVPEGSDAVQEVKKCVEYSKKILA